MKKTDIEKSHSKLSNFNLTLIALLCAISLSLIVVSLSYFGSNLQEGLPIIIGSGVLLLLSLVLLSRFKR